MRSKRAFKSMLASLGLQLITIISGLIVPRIIIGNFGSDVNGLISSITQFLGYIVLLESGVGGVVRAALYKPLAKKDNEQISAIIKATAKFFKIIGALFVVYLVFLTLLYPFVVSEEFEYLYTSSLIIIIGVSTFVQYYFGITYQILLQADQKKYVTDLIQIVTVTINTILVVLLVYNGASVHIMRLGSSIIFILRPLMINYYVMKKYNINLDVKPDNQAINQRWDGLGHHMAYIIHNNTDVAVLTLFLGVTEVSVYVVYYMVISSIKKIIKIFTQSLEAAFGNMIANEEKDALTKNFSVFELTTFAITTILFTSTALLILPFVTVYTAGVEDANYFRPMFAFTLILAEAMYSIRTPYNAVVLAAGHYKQTRNGGFVEAGINIIFSIILVINYGMIGVAIGTLLAMTFRTIQYVHYLSHKILKRSLWVFYKKFIIFMVGSVVSIMLVLVTPDLTVNNYIDWIIYALISTTIVGSVISIQIWFLYRDELKEMLNIIKRLKSNKTKK